MADSFLRSLQRIQTGGNPSYSSIAGFTSQNRLAGLGYYTGAGSAVTQLVSKSSGVTAQGMTGQITMHTASLGSGTIVSFVLTNSSVAATDYVGINHESGGSQGAYSFAAAPAAGSATIFVRNNSGTALAEGLVLRFVLLRSANA